MLAVVLNVGVVLIAALIGLYASRWWYVLLWTAIVAAIVTVSTGQLALPSVLATAVGLLARWFSRSKSVPSDAVNERGHIG